MKRSKVLVVIALIALTGFLSIACDSGGGGGGGGGSYLPSDKTTAKDAGIPSLSVPGLVFLVAHEPIVTSFDIPFTATNCASNILDWEISSVTYAKFTAGPSATIQTTGVNDGMRMRTQGSSGKATITYVSGSPAVSLTNQPMSATITVYGYKNRTEAEASSASPIPNSAATSAKNRVGAEIVATINVRIYYDLTVKAIYIINKSYLEGLTYYDSDTPLRLLTMGSKPWANQSIRLVTEELGTMDIPFSSCDIDVSGSITNSGPVDDPIEGPGPKTILIDFQDFADGLAGPLELVIKAANIVADEVVSFTVQTPPDDTIYKEGQVDNSDTVDFTMVRFRAVWKNPNRDPETLEVSEVTETVGFATFGGAALGVNNFTYDYEGWAASGSPAHGEVSIPIRWYTLKSIAVSGNINLTETAVAAATNWSSLAPLITDLTGVSITAIYNTGDLSPADVTQPDPAVKAIVLANLATDASCGAFANTPLQPADVVTVTVGTIDGKGSFGGQAAGTRDFTVTVIADS